MPQHGHVLDAVRPGDHARDQGRDLQTGVAAAWPVDPDVLGDQLVEPGPLGELQDRRETGARHDVGVIEDRGEAVGDSHPADALPCRDFVTFASHILPEQ